MKKSKMVSLALIVAGVATIAACKKPANNNYLVGSWRLTAVAADVNGNGIRDANEIMPPDTSAQHLILKFNADGTLSENYYGATVVDGHWEYVYNRTYIKVINNTNDTSYSKIETLNANTLSIVDTAGGLNWAVFSKI